MQHSLNHRSKMRAVVALASVLVTWLFAFGAQASPEAKILRVDPRAAQENGNPILTSRLMPANLFRRVFIRRSRATWRACAQHGRRMLIFILKVKPGFSVEPHVLGLSLRSLNLTATPN